MGRQQLSWPKIILVILFLNGLLVIPVSIHYARSESFTLEPTFPAVFSMVDDEVVAALDTLRTEEGQTTFSEPFHLRKGSGVVAGGLAKEEAEQVLQEETALLFEEGRLIMKEGELPLTEVPYTSDVRWERLDSPEQVRAELNRQWFIANRVYIVATYSMLIAVMLLAMNVFLVLGAAFFLYVAGRSGAMDIDSFKESVNLILNGMGLAAVVASLVGLLVPDITFIMSTLTFGLIVMIVSIYYKTRFSDGFLERQRLRAEGKLGEDQEE